MNDVQQQLDNLVTLYGPEKVRSAAKKLLDISSRSIPAEHFALLRPEAVENTVRRLVDIDNAIQVAIQHRQAVDGNKAELIQEKTQLETGIKLAEAEAFMNTGGEGKEQYGLIGNKKILLNNEANRDAYRRSYSAEERRQLADICGEINAVDVDLSRATDTLGALSSQLQATRAKAELQAALLNFLAGRGA